MTIWHPLASLLFFLCVCSTAGARSITIQPTQHGGAVAEIFFDDSFCARSTFSSANVSGTQISVFFDAAPPQCGTQITGPFLLTLPALAAGNYQLNVMVTGFSPPLPNDVIFTFTLPTAVAATIAPLPSLDVGALLLLCSALFFAACRRMRWDVTRKMSHG